MKDNLKNKFFYEGLTSTLGMTQFVAFFVCLFVCFFFCKKEERNLACKNSQWVLFKSLLVLALGVKKVELRLKQKLDALSQVTRCSRHSAGENLVNQK